MIGTKTLKNLGRRTTAVCLTLCMALSLLPVSALAAPRAATTTTAAHSCGVPTRVTSFAELQTSINRGDSDILLSPASGDAATWNFSAALTVSSGRTIHIRVEEGKTVTLKRPSSLSGSDLITVAAGGKLILGDGQITYTGSDLTEAAKAGNYTVTQKAAGSLIIDGGATFTDTGAWTPGNALPSNAQVVLYNDEGQQRLYTRGGVTTSKTLVLNNGTLDLWDGVTLQNNILSAGQASYGSAIQSMSGSTLNMFGGLVSRCLTSSSDNDTGRGAVFIGTFNTNNWNSTPTITNSHFNMYGGSITHNATVNDVQDGGGVSVETAYMDLYGGSISYNHGGLSCGEGSGDGGGVMVRNNAIFTMWGGSVDHNFAGGYGGGIVAWNATVNIKGGEITQNKASYGGGLAIASSNGPRSYGTNNKNEAVTAKVLMTGGTIAFNEAINTISSSAGIGGGIVVGAGIRTMGSTLDLQGGVIRNNTAVNGGGMGIYAGGGEAEGSIRNTSVTMSGDFQLTTNSADQNGNGMYITNNSGESSPNPNNRHYLLKMSGGAKIDTNNPVFFANLCRNQVPVRITDTLTTEGTAAIFEFADSFWNNNPGNNYAGVTNVSSTGIVSFAKNVQENKIALESSDWYFKSEGSVLTLRSQDDHPQYTIRNGTPVTVDGKVYYRVYAILANAVNEAADGDTLYIFYNTTISTTATVSGKRLTLMAESTSSAGRDAGLSGSGATKTCWLEQATDGDYTIMRGNFLQYVGTGGSYNVNGSNATSTTNGKYSLTTNSTSLTNTNTLSYNVRNDYTITLSSRLHLGEATKGNSAGQAAIVVSNGATLDIGQAAVAGMGVGALTFDGNLSSPKEGPMFQVSGTLNLHNGITVKNHSNYSEAHPGVVEVRPSGSFIMDEGAALTGNTSPIAGAVYNTGTFTMNGGSISANTGAMPRYGFFTNSGSRLGSYDSAFWGQGKYYSGAGAVYNLGTFRMNGGSVTTNRGEYGALANLGSGVSTLSGGAISANRALVGRGEGDQSLTVTGYIEGGLPAIPSDPSPDAGLGGGLYVGGGSVTVSRGVTISKNFAINGGGAAAGKGRDLTRAITGYANVSNGYEHVTSGSITAKLPTYSNISSTLSSGSLIFQGGTIDNNTASELGGGILATGRSAHVQLEQPVTLQRNTAKYGGGAAAVQEGSVSFYNEIMENTATFGGGVYVGGNSAVDARGSVTANQARHGGGAYVDCGSSPTDPDNTAPSTTDSTPGTLTLSGSTVNNNRLEGNGFGIGVYNRGKTILQTNDGVQPFISYNDRVFLERGHVLELASSYDITQSGQAANNRLTLESRDTANGTQIIQAASQEQAAALLTSKLAAHYTHPMALNQTTTTNLELNSVPVHYYDRFSAAGPLQSHHVEVAYASGDTVILQNFSVGDDAGFAEPAGKSFLYWVTTDKNGHYLNSNGVQVDSPELAHTYYAGNTITNITAPVYLEAVYGTVQYSASFLIVDEDGDVISNNDESVMGSIDLLGANYNSGTGQYSFAMGTPLTISAAPVRQDRVSNVSDPYHTLLQDLTLYRQVSQRETDDDIHIGDVWFTPIITSSMETETLSVPGGGNETVISTGKINSITAKAGVTAALEEDGIHYTGSDANILIRARFKQGLVRLQVAPALAGRLGSFGAPTFSGYYDTMHEAITAVGARLAAGGDAKTSSYTLTLLGANSADGSNTVRYYGEKGDTPANCVDNQIVGSLGDDDMIHITYDLNEYAVDYQSFGERNLQKYDMTIKNGQVIYNGDTDRNTPADPKPAAFRVAYGTLTLDNVTVTTTATAPNGGHNDRVYSAKVMEGGTLNIGQGCHLGDVFIYTDRDDIQQATPERPSQTSGHVTVTSTFVEGRADPVATLCLRYWDFGNQVRRVIALSDDVATAEGVSIRRLFSLKDVDGDGTDNARYWFIGTDGRLYKKAAAVETNLVATKATTGGSDSDGLPVCYWSYKNKNGKPEIGDHSGDANAAVDDHVNWVGGYPFYYDYTSDYGYDTTTSIELTATLVDAKGEVLPVDRGTMSFTVSRVINTANDDGSVTTTNRRNFGGVVGMTSSGVAHLNFSTLASLPATATPDLINWTTPSSYYIVSALWSGTGQYAPQYAQYWNYSYGADAEKYAGISGSTLTGAIRLSHLRKAMSEPDITVVDITPRSVEFIGQAGVQAGYTSAPTVGRVQDTCLNSTMLPGSDYDIYYAALTPILSNQVVKNGDGQPLVCDYNGDTYYYMAGENGGKIYYSIGGRGLKDGSTPLNARDLNGADAGPYSVALEADTLPNSNYSGQSGWKNTLFTIHPYSSSLSITGPNHVVVNDKEESYPEKITAAFSAPTTRSTITVTDRYGNRLPLEQCAFTFAPISGSARLDENGWPSAEGLYNLVVTPKGHGNGTLKLDGVAVDVPANPNYADTAEGYLAILITNKHLNVFFVPEEVSVPYTGQIYTSDSLKKFDSQPDGYQVWRVEVDGNGQPLDTDNNIITDVTAIPLKGKNAEQLATRQYRVDIGSPQHTPRDTGAYTTVVTDISGGYIGIGTLNITSQKLGSITLSDTSGLYTGANHTPAVTATDTAGQTLTLNRDYIIQITNADGDVVAAPINAGEYTYTAIGINNYVDASVRPTSTYTVIPKSIGNNDVVATAQRRVILDAPGYATMNTDTGSLTPRYSLYYNGMTLVRGVDGDYQQEITSGGATIETITGPGTYTFTIRGQGNYTGSTTFTLTVDRNDSDLRITNSETYSYSGCKFADYNWPMGATVNWVPDGGTARQLDASRFDVRIERYEANRFVPVDNEAILDAGVYRLTLSPMEDYAADVDGLEVTDEGSCVFQIQRHEVTIQPAAVSKVYGENDPDFSQHYTTDLPGAEANGFYLHDADQVTGTFYRNTGEDVRNSGYRYTLGSFSAGDNYLLTIGLENVFTILPKSLNAPTNPADDDIIVTRRASLSYTGYSLEPIQNVTYNAQRGTLNLADQANYLTSYERYVPCADGCTPEHCQVENPTHTWESITVTPADVGWYRVTVDGDACVTSPNNYEGSRSYLFEIQAQGGDLELSVEGDATVTYKNGDYTPIVSVRREGFALSQEYYALSYSFAPADGSATQVDSFVSGQTNFKAAGVYTIYAAGRGNYAGSAGSVTFTILPKNLAEDDAANGTAPVDIKVADAHKSFVYDGNPHRADITASYAGEALETADYTLSYQNHTNAGAATVTVTGRGNYTGVRTLTYTIEKQPLTISLGNNSKTYGSADPTYTYIAYNAEGQEVSVPFTGTVSRVADANGEDVGSYALAIGTLSAGGNYQLTLAEHQSLTITAKSLGNGSAAADNISASSPSYVAVNTTVGDLKKQVSVTYWSPALGQKQLAANTDYTLTVTKKDETTPLTDSNSLSGGDYTITVNAAGGNYLGSFPLSQVKVVDAESLLDLGTPQTVVYRIDGYTFSLTPRTKDGIMEDCTITLLYNGSSSSNLTQKPDGSFDLDLADAGTYTITATKNAGDQTYFGTVTYVVQPKNIAEDDEAGNGKATVNPLEGDFSYTGSEVTVTNATALLSYGGQTIRDKDSGRVNYIVGYSGNVNPGKATLTIYGQGNYTGVREVNFNVGEVRYHVAYNTNGAASGTAPTDNSLYLTDEYVTIQGNTGNLASGNNAVFLGWCATQIEHAITSRDQLTGELFVSGSLYKMGASDVILYAVWAADANGNGLADCDEDKYTVKYQFAKDDACSGNVPVDASAYLSGATVTVQGNVGTLALNGYILLGWAPGVESGLTQKLETSEEFLAFVNANDLYADGRTFSMGQKNVILTAIWGADKNNNGKLDWMEGSAQFQFFVAYDGNGGAGNLPASHSLKEETLEATVAPNYKPGDLTRAGHTLLGWTAQPHPALTTAPDGTYTVYQPNDKHIIALSDANPVVFYALWAVDENNNIVPDYEEPRYTVSYTNVCDDVTSVDAPTPVTGKLTGTTVRLPESLTGAGTGLTFTFLGWTMTQADAEVVYTRGQTPDSLLQPGSAYIVEDSDVVFYPVWGETHYNESLYTITVTPTPSAGGTAESDKTSTLAGENATVTIHVNDGYALDQVLVNGEAKTPDILSDDDKTGRDFSLSLPDIRENKSVVVTFLRSAFSVGWPAAATYNAQRQEPTLNVVSSNAAATQLTATNYDLTVELGGKEVEWDEAFTNAGLYTITVTGKDEYKGSEVRITYVIEPAALSEVTLKEGDRPYKGSAYDDEIASVKAGELTVPSNGYTVEYRDNLNQGTATVTIAGKDNFTGVLTKTFDISAASSDSLTAAWNTAPSITYDGQPHRPIPTVTVAGNDTLVLTENVDYTLSYSDDVTNAGQKTVTVTGKGNFTGAETSIVYTIKTKSLGETDKTDGTPPVQLLTMGDQIFTGSALTPDPILLYGDSPVLSLTKGADYTVQYAANTAVGTATVTVAGTGNYTGGRETTFTINASGSGMTMADSVSKVYNGSTYSLTQDDLQVKVGEAVLKFGDDYTVAYTAIQSTGAALDNDLPSNAGTYSVAVTGKGSYSGLVRGTLVITPAVLTAITVGDTAFSYDGEAHVPELTAVKAGSLTLSEDDYTVIYRDAAGNETTSAPINIGSYTMVVTGLGNFTGSLTQKFQITSEKTLTVGDLNEQTYKALPYQPKPQVKDGNRVLTENVDYTLTYPDDSINAGEKEGKVTGINNYAGYEGTFSYTINQKTLSDATNISIIVSDQVYTGAAVTPTVTVTYRTNDGRVLFLTKDKDFTVEYSNNTAVGKASVTVTGKGNYKDTKTGSFEITSAGTAALNVTAGPAVFAYDGTAKTPTTITVVDGETTLAEGTDYEVSYSAVTGKLDNDGKPVAAGTYNLVVTGKGNYDGANGVTSLAITPAPLGEITVESATLTYDGAAKTPEITVKDADGNELTKDTDYTLTYSGNVNAGTASVSVVGTGNYSGADLITFPIQPATVVITPTATSKTYGQSDPALNYTASVNGLTLTGALNRAPGETAGDYDYTLDTLREQSGNYILKLAEDAQFTVQPKSLSDTDSITQSPDLTVGYTGAPFNQSVTTLYSASLGDLLLSADDYEVSFSQGGNPVAEAKEPGTYQVTVSAKADGNYTGNYTFDLTIDNGILGVAFTDAGSSVTYNGSDWAAGMVGRLTASFNGNPVTLTDSDLTFKDAAGNTVTEIVNAGAYTIVVNAASYDTVELPFHVLPKDIGDVTFSAIGDQAYDGTAKTPAVALTDGGNILTGADFTADYLNNLNAGTATAAVTGKGNYTGTATQNFTITAKSLADIDVTAPNDVVFTGAAQAQKPTVDGLTETRDYTLSYSKDLVNVGTVTVTVTAAGNYTGTKAVTYDITPKTIQKSWITVSPSSVAYTGSSQEPMVLVANGSTLLIKGVDFTTAYANNTEVGTATVTITGKGNYEGEESGSFQIAAAGGASFNVSSRPASKVYTGSAQEPALITVKNGDGTLLVKGTDYTVSYAAVTGTLDDDGKPVAAGSYNVVVSGQGNYAGSTGMASFIITPAALGNVAVDGEGIVYDGGEKTPSVTVKNTAGEVLTLDEDYTLEYSNNTNAGTATVTVAGMGNYAGAKLASFTIAPAEGWITPFTSVEDAYKIYGTLDGTLTHISSPDSLDFVGALTRKFGENVGEYPLDIGTLRETNGNYTLRLMQNLDGSDYVFTIKPKDLADADVEKTENLTVGYTGAAFDLPVTTLYHAELGDLLLSDSDYELTFTDADGDEVTPINAGEYTVTVTGKGNYEGSYTFTLTIDPTILGVAINQGTVVYDNATDWTASMADRLSAFFDGAPVALSADNLTFKDAEGNSVDEIMDAGAYTVVVSVENFDPVEVPFHVLPKNISDVDFAAIDSVPYDGTEQEPEVALTDGGIDLAEGVDFTVAYQNNVAAGTANAVVTGKGNYTGTAAKSFAITTKSLADITVTAPSDTEFNGSVQTRVPTVDGLVQGRDYTLTYTGDLINKGTVTVLIDGVGNYTGSQRVSYQITPKAIRADWITVTPGQVVYTGAEQTPMVLVSDGSTRLIEGWDYELTYADNTEIGTATATVSGLGNYEGSKTASFRIGSTAAVLAVSAGKASAVYNGADQKPNLTVVSNGAYLTTGTDYTATYSYNGIDKGAFAADTQFVDSGVYVITVSGSGSYEGSSGTVTFVITPAALTMVEIADQDYTGAPIIPQPTVTREGSTDALVLNTDYALSYANNVAIGSKTASVTATGLGNYAGSIATVNFTITGEHTLFFITYDGNGSSSGSLPTDAQGYLSGAQATVLSGQNLGKLSAVFLGWSTEKTALVTSRTAQDAITLLRPGNTVTVKADTTLFAVWGADTNNNGRPDYAENVVITASAGEGGSISPSGRNTVDWGTKQVKYTITAESGYSFSRLTVDNKEIPVSTAQAPSALVRDGNNYVYTFTDLMEDHVILATFRSNSGGGGGGGNFAPAEEPDLTKEDLEKSGVTKWLLTGDHIAYMEGRGDGNFWPDASLSRAEAAMVFYRLLKNKTVKVTAHFTDVSEDAWYATAVNTLASLGVLQGVGNGCFEPDRSITRAEFAAIISRLSDPANIKEVRSYTDIEADDWFYDYVQRATYYGWITGYPDGSFGPQRNISRSELVKVVNAMTGRLSDSNAIAKGAGRRFGDVAESHWAFYQIVEATTTHDYNRTGRSETWKKD